MGLGPIAATAANRRGAGARMAVILPAPRPGRGPAGRVIAGVDGGRCDGRERRRPTRCRTGATRADARRGVGMHAGGGGADRRDPAGPRHGCNPRRDAGARPGDGRRGHRCRGPGPSLAGARHPAGRRGAVAPARARPRVAASRGAAMEGSRRCLGRGDPARAHLAAGRRGGGARRGVARPGAWCSPSACRWWTTTAGRTTSCSPTCGSSTTRSSASSSARGPPATPRTPSCSTWLWRSRGRTPSRASRRCSRSPSRCWR